MFLSLLVQQGRKLQILSGVFGKKEHLCCTMSGINKLREKWGLAPMQFWLVILTFALGGSLSGRLCSYLLKMAFSEKNWAFWLVYPVVLTILWPFSVLFVSLLTGQFRFFKGYLGRVGAKLIGGVGAGSSGSVASGSSAAPIHVAIFASGAGSNARKIIEYFENQSLSEFPTKSTRPIKVSLIVCNVPTAGVLEIAKEKGIPTLLINKTEFASGGYVESLKNADIDFIVLAGFLWKVPEVLVKAYQKGAVLNNQGRTSFGIINIHPALLPNYGGKGMYGGRVHEAVIAAGESKSGITIHWVDANYDEGDIIFQAECTIESGDTPELLAQKIHALEHQHFAPVIEKLLRNK
jgi:folate-dependent phosphoribosylglycinamide formyltransferase PurN